eukprot:TRINITY_DN38133_c0_g1_i1.p1 TRINITY_DN38133_c0_g1~~TRINITY_DN38133_c0_g1_i1.p1  ORF type:complete len:275 (-),score=26.11 TRINITY_DN38133_c0_g1_i1:222-1046(-)
MVTQLVAFQRTSGVATSCCQRVAVVFAKSASVFSQRAEVRTASYGRLIHWPQAARVYTRGASTIRANENTAVSDSWPERSYTFEPPWEAGPLPKFFMVMPNTMETFFRLREVQAQLAGKEDLRTVDAFNQLFMERFLDFHGHIEASRNPKRRQPSVARPGAAVGHVTPSHVGGSRFDLASAAAREMWSSERPSNAISWDFTPHSCQVVQARRAEHHDRLWLQVIVRLTGEEQWTVRGNPTDSRLREHFVVFEMPSNADSRKFRIAEIRLDVGPV